METVEISKLFQDNINSVLVPNRYKHIINRSNNLGRFDIINRILIEIQCPEAYDVRTANEWIIDNRSIKSKSKGINIIIPMYEHCYIDTKTNEKINSDDLTLDELNAAIKYNIVQRKDNMETTYVQTVFDIKQTRSLDNSKYNVEKPILKSSSLLSILNKITGCKIEKSDITYYSRSSNTLTVAKQDYKELASTIVDILVDYYMSDKIKLLIGNTQFSEYDIDLIRYTLQYSLDTMFRDDRDCDFDIVRHTSTDKILNVLNIADSVVFNIASIVEYNKEDSIKVDMANNMEVMRKAEVLLDIMEANNINKKMKGI